MSHLLTGSMTLLTLLCLWPLVYQEYESIYKANVAVMANPARQLAVPRRKRGDDGDETDDPRYFTQSLLHMCSFIDDDSHYQ